MAWKADPETAARATQRALFLLRVLDREHTNLEAHAVMRAVRQELNTVALHLPLVGDMYSVPEVSPRGEVQPSMFE